MILKAKETGICQNREKLYSECFDELTRQVTINCLERGILMKLVKSEYENQMKSYQNLYQSSVAYGIRKWMIANKEKQDVNEQIKQIEKECEQYEEEIKNLELEIEKTRIEDENERKEAEENHKATCLKMVADIQETKAKIKKNYLNMIKVQNANKNQ